MCDRLLDQNYLDTFVCELSRIDNLGGNRRLIFELHPVLLTPSSANSACYSNSIGLRYPIVECLRLGS